MTEKQILDGVVTNTIITEVEHQLLIHNLLHNTLDQNGLMTKDINKQFTLVGEGIQSRLDVLVRRSQQGGTICGNI